MEGITQASEARLYSRDLPADIVFDILLKLPVKSLLLFRCVSKVLRNIIDSPFFANKHTHAAAEEPELMHIESCPPGLYSVRYDGNIMRENKYPILKISCHDIQYLSYGLFCIHNGGYRGNAILFNPLRREVMILPQATVSTIPSAQYEWYGLGFDATTETYKIVRLFGQQQVICKAFSYQKLGAEVYTLGTKSWRPISSGGGGPPCNVFSNVVSAYGDVHWQNRGTYPKENAEGMINSHGFTQKRNDIISFNSRKEAFNWTPNPDYEDQKYQRVHLLNLRASLAMVGFFSLRAFDIWVMKDYDTKEWAREYRVRIEYELLARELKRQRAITIIGAWEHGLCFHDFSEPNIYLYSLKTDCMQSVSYQSPRVADTRIKKIISYTRTLVSLQNYGHMIAAEELGPGLSYVLNRADLVYIIP